MTLPERRNGCTEIPPPPRTPTLEEQTQEASTPVTVDQELRKRSTSNIEQPQPTGLSVSEPTTNSGPHPGVEGSNAPDNFHQNLHPDYTLDLRPQVESEDPHPQEESSSSDEPDLLTEVPDNKRGKSLLKKIKPYLQSGLREDAAMFRGELSRTRSGRVWQSPEQNGASATGDLERISGSPNNNNNNNKTRGLEAHLKFAS